CNRNGWHAGTHHLLGPIQELRHIHAHNGRRNQAEIRKNRIAPSDVRPAEEDAPKAVAFGNLLQLRARIRNCEEVTAGFLGANEPLDTVEEILFENIGLERRARLARYDEERVFQIDFVLEGPHLSWIGRIEHVKFREPADRAEGRLDYFRAEARSPHSHKQDRGEAGPPGGFSNTGQAINVTQLVIGNAEPSEPLRFIFAAPERRIPAPELSDIALSAPLGQRLLHGGG